MIEVTKMSGERIFVNADLVETVESQPDTQVTLVNGKHFLVREPAAEVVRRITEYQRIVRAGWSDERTGLKRAKAAGRDAEAGQD